MIVKTGLENLLKSRWTEWLDKTQLIRKVMIDTRDAELGIAKDGEVKPSSPVKVMVSSIDFVDRHSPYFELTVDFQIARDNGVATGFHIYKLNLKGDLQLVETHGNLFK